MFLLFLFPSSDNNACMHNPLSKLNSETPDWWDRLKTETLQFTRVAIDSTGKKMLKLLPGNEPERYQILLPLNQARVDIATMLGSVPLFCGVKFWKSIPEAMLQSNYRTTDPDAFFKKADGTGYKTGVFRARRKEMLALKDTCHWWTKGTTPSLTVASSVQ